MPVSQETNALDLYASIEDLLGVKEAAPDLYAHYLLTLQTVAFDSLLDVGCGSGDFIASIQNAFPKSAFCGIDLSPEMVVRAREQGVEAEVIDLCDEGGRYRVITAVFDMLNYLDPSQLVCFGQCVREHLEDGGYFLCDINTLYGFEEVAVGSFIAEDADRFVAIDSDFEAGVYVSDFTLFERDRECWTKSAGTIRQYHHTIEAIEQATGLKLIKKTSVNLYGEEEADKLFVVFQKQ
jgi:predicted TPR repeat methyltransferase